MRGPKRRKWHIILIATVLAIVCIGGVELLACRVAEPELYEQITAPARQGAEKLAQAGQAAWTSVCQTGAELWDGVCQTGEALRLRLEEALAPKEDESDFTMQLSQPDLAPPNEILDPLISDLITEDGQEYITGGGVDVVYFNQTDESRAEQKYGTDPLGTHGCGPTAMAMAVSTLTDTIIDPADMAARCVQDGYWCKSHGSYHAIVKGIAASYGLECIPLDPAALDENELYARLSDGDLVVALMTTGHFTKNGHFILLRGVTLGGEILVADPASRERSLIPWDLSLILEELSRSRSDGSPLWLLSRTEEIQG